MDSDSWNTRFSTSFTRRYQSRSDLYRHEEIDCDEESKLEFLCPFCAEDFDVVGLCCHIDEEHPVEAKNGVCPVCAKRVGSDIVTHITSQHGNLLKVQRRRKLRKNGSGFSFSLLRKELREGYLQALLGGSSSVGLSVNSEPDPLLSSFMYGSPDRRPESSIEPPVLPLAEAGPPRHPSHAQSSSDRSVVLQTKAAHMSSKEQEETARKSEFVRGLLLSTILDEL